MDRDLIKLLMQVAVSLGLLASGLFILLTIDWAENPELGAPAAGWVGLVAG